MKPSRSALIVAFATIYIVWGSTYLGIRIAVETIPPFLMASLRFLAAGSLILGFLRLRGPLDIKIHQVRDNAIVGIFALTRRQRTRFLGRDNYPFRHHLAADWIPASHHGAH